MIDCHGGDLRKEILTAHLYAQVYDGQTSGSVAYVATDPSVNDPDHRIVADPKETQIQHTMDLPFCMFVK